MSTICRRSRAFRPRWRLCCVAPWHPNRRRSGSAPTSSARSAKRCAISAHCSPSSRTARSRSSCSRSGTGCARSWSQSSAGARLSRRSLELAECHTRRPVGLTRPWFLQTGPKSQLRAARSRRSVASGDSGIWVMATLAQKIEPAKRMRDLLEEGGSLSRTSSNTVHLHQAVLQRHESRGRHRYRRTRGHRSGRCVDRRLHRFAPWSSLRPAAGPSDAVEEHVELVDNWLTPWAIAMRHGVNAAVSLDRRAAVDVARTTVRGRQRSSSAL